jgi:antirestriction protein ArdC
MGRMISRNDTALHRNTHDRNHPIARGARLARHLSIAAWQPLRALEQLIHEVEACRCQVNHAVMLRARAALDAARPYLNDDTGEIWK